VSGREKGQDKVSFAAAVMQITGTAYMIWMGVSSASSGETKKATWGIHRGICVRYFRRDVFLGLA
jgi:threonine/homoserine/homoserine lactone efflux protein